MSFETRNRKHVETWSLICQFLFFIIILIALKFMNQIFLGTQEWYVNSSKLFANTNADWFAEKINVGAVFNGPIGFASLISFKTVFGTEVVLPVLFDLVINWAFIIILIFYVIMVNISLIKENRVNRILKELKLEDGLKEQLNYEYEPQTSLIEEDALEVKKPEESPKPKAKPAVAKKPKPIVAKEPKPKPAVAKKPKPKPKAKPAVAKKPKPIVAKEPAPQVKDTTDEFVTKTIKIKVVKKHYDQTSKSDLLEKLHVLYPNETKVAIKETVDAVFETITNNLLKKEEVVIYGFGKFESQFKESREGINPLTGEELVIPSSNSVKFKIAKNIKEEMSNQKWTGLYNVDKDVEVKEKQEK